MPWKPTTTILGAAVVSFATAVAYATVTPRPTVVTMVLLVAAVLVLVFAVAARRPALRVGLLAGVVVNQVVLMLPSPLFLPAALASVAAAVHVLEQQRMHFDRWMWVATTFGATIGAAATVVAIVVATAGPGGAGAARFVTATAGQPTPVVTRSHSDVVSTMYHSSDRR